MEPITFEELTKKKEELKVLDESLKTLKPIIDELKEDKKVKEYITFNGVFEKTCNTLGNLIKEIKYQKMYYCDHYFVVNEQRSDFDGHRYEKTTIKTCIHCGLTNRYIHLYMDSNFPEYNDMNEVFINSGAHNYETHGFYNYSDMEDVKKEYKKFKNDNPTATDKQIEKHLRLVKELKEKK